MFPMCNGLLPFVVCPLMQCVILYFQFSAPALSSRGTTKASISASINDVSSRSPWKSYTNNELSRKVDIDENSSSVITSPFLKSFMQVNHVLFALSL